MSVSGTALLVVFESLFYTSSAIETAPFAVYIVEGDRDFEYSTDIIDFDMPASIKTIESLDIDASFDDKTSVEVMASYRNNKHEAFRDTPWKRVSPEGYCALMLSGSEFILNVRMTPCVDIELANIIAHIKLSDKRYIRSFQTR